MHLSAQPDPDSKQDIRTVRVEEELGRQTIETTGRVTKRDG